MAVVYLLTMVARGTRVVLMDLCQELGSLEM